jgi:hypothetical protein
MSKKVYADTLQWRLQAGSVHVNVGIADRLGDAIMERRLLRNLATSALISVATTGCHATMATSTSSGPSSALPEGHYTNVGAEWPLKFRAHYFGISTYSTYGCRVEYAGRVRVDEPADRLQPSSEALGSRYPDNMTAGAGPIGNFPSPAKVSWRSKDGTALQAEIDIGEIFKDELIRHRVAREDALDPASSGTPGIILEVNDRTINVYMRDMIALKKPRFPDRPHSDFRNDLIKVFSQTY